MRLDLRSVCAVAGDQPSVLVTVVATFGSTPREVGARMLVHRDGFVGSIGGGQLEYQELAAARAMLDAPPGPWQRAERRITLGPDAGQCCGGVVDVLHERFEPGDLEVLRRLIGCDPEGAVQRAFASGVAPVPAHAVATLTVAMGDDVRTLIEPIVDPATPLFLYGAGHVARALVPIVAALPFRVTWIDIDARRFPDTCPPDVESRVSPHPATEAARSPPGSYHLVMTHAHDLDAEICQALLVRDDVAFVGLIGSATKRARFVQRFRRAGLSEAAVARLVCPIGLPGIPGKAPMAVAVAVAAQLMVLVQHATSATFMTS